MAGGKETPRQKMIGMMYLVLTALLALNVSSAVLEKFAILNTTLQELVSDVNDTNDHKLAGIKNTKSEKAEVLQAVAKAEKVRQMTKSTLIFLDSVKQILSSDHAGLPLVGGELVSNTNLAEEKMLDEKSTLAPAYEKALNDYHSQLQEISNMKFPVLTKKAVDFPELQNESGEVEHADLNFIDFSFEGTPTMPAITSVTQMQTQILEYEGLVLDSLNGVAQGQLIKFDKVVPMVIGPTVVAAGAKYEGRMFMAGASSGVTPQMFRDGSPLAVALDPETGIKMAKVEFTASARKKSFTAVIKTLGQDPFSREINYNVISPTIRVTTGNRPTLYMNCGNFVNFEVPALGASFNPTFRSKGATLRKGDKIGKVVIVPKRRKVFVTVVNGGTAIGTEEFDVKQIPKPRYEPKDNSGRLIDLKKGVKGSGLNQLRVSVESDENFKREVPKDARYRIRSLEVTWVRGISPVAPPVTVTSGLINLNSWRGRGFRGGDRLVIDIKSVTRRTYLNEEEKVDVLPGTNIISIPIAN